MRRLRAVRGTGRSFQRIVIVGGGRAGVAAAEELRRQGYDREIVLLSDEVDAPYDRPSCSKGLISGRKRPIDAKMPYQSGLDLRWQMGRSAIDLDPDNKIVVTDTDEVYEYDGLVIATGSKPNRPKEWPWGEPGIHTCHSLADAWALRHDLRRAKRVAVVGAGLTGSEVACTVRSLAREAVLIHSQPFVMGRAIGETLGRFVTEEVERDGVHLRLGHRVKGIRRRRGGWAVQLDDGSEEYADVVVGTLGDKPDTTWLASARNIDSSDGVLCDEYLRVVGAPDVVAAGTTARWPNLRYSTKPTRPGQWIMALEMGRAAAAQLLAGDYPLRPVALVPRFWSEQYGLRIQFCGKLPAEGKAEMTVTRLRPSRRDVAKSGVLIGYYEDGNMVGLAGSNAMRTFTTSARMMLAAPTPLVEVEPTRERLTMPVAPRRLAAVG